MKLIYKLTFIISLIFYSNTFKTQTQKQVEKNIDSAISKMFKKEHSLSLEILIKAKTIAEKKKWESINFRATNNIGANYFLMTDYGEALKYYLEAYDIAINMKDKKNVMTIINNIGILYLNERKHNKAYEYFTKSYNLSKENNDQEKSATYAINLSFVLNKLGKTKLAYQYIIDAQKHNIKNNKNLERMRQLALAENLFLKQKNNDALKIIDDLLPEMNAIDDSENKIFLLLIKSEIFERNGDYKKALDYALEARKTSKNIKDRNEIYNRIASVYSSLKNYDFAFRYKDSIVIATDSIAKQNNNALFNNGKIKFEMQNYQFEIKQSEEKLKDQRTILYITITASVIIIILITLILLSNSTKYKQQQKISILEVEKEKTDNLLLTQQLKEQETISLLEKERLKNEIEIQNRQLTSQALNLSSRNEIIEEIINAIVKQPELSNNKSLLSYLTELKIQLKSATQWDSFFKHFEGVNQNFINSLREKHPELTSSEIRFICYIYMNLSHKEIASILNISPESCRKRKERLTKKLNLQDKQDLYDYISNT